MLYVDEDRKISTVTAYQRAAAAVNPDRKSQLGNELDDFRVPRLNDV